jgi:hypothetical protein
MGHHLLHIKQNKHPGDKDRAKKMALNPNLHPQYDEKWLMVLGGLMNEYAIQVRDPYFYFIPGHIVKLRELAATDN